MDAFARGLLERARRIRLGDPLHPNSEMGAVSCRMQYDKIRHRIEVAKAEGAQLLCG